MSSPSYHLPNGIEINGKYSPEFSKILTPDALAFVAKLQREFNKRRLSLLRKREDRQLEIDKGMMPDFLHSTENIRRDKSWKVVSTPHD